MVSIWDKTQIAQAREEAKMSAMSAASLLNIVPEYLSMIENGHRQPSQKVIQKMSVLYRRPVSYFLKPEENSVKM